MADRPIARRAFVHRLAHGALALPLPAAFGTPRTDPTEPGPADRARRAPRLLVFTKSAGYRHSTVIPAADGVSPVGRALAALGAAHGFEVTSTDDGRIFDPPALHEYDAFLFVTTGDLTTRGTDGAPPMSAAGKHALLEAVGNGKGFIGVHNAADTFPSPAGGAVDPYIAMLGGEFAAHGQPQVGTVRVAAPAFPGMPAGPGIERMSEWYAFRNVAPDIRPLLVLETGGLEGGEYRRPPYPVAWTRRHGTGRVAYNALGHFDEEWSDPVFREMLRGLVVWATGGWADRG